MFTIEPNEQRQVPIKVWLPDISAVEESCLEQAYHLAELPFVHKWVCLMPDTHAGMGMPIGGVIATKDVIIPNAVGVDIGCGMAFVGTNIRYEDVKDIQTGNGSFIQAIVGEIMRNIPVGFEHFKEPQYSYTLSKAEEELNKYENEAQLIGQIDAGYFQMGTLGGGNHFIEVQEDDDGYMGFMIHSGSRHFGKSVCDYFHNAARDLNRKYYSSVPDDYRLAFLPVDSSEGKAYINWMKLSMDFAQENREKMMIRVKEIFRKYIGKFTDLELEFSDEINCHHNYAAIENHYGENVWVHRKGAIRARVGDISVIPGAMGSYSYVVQGLGNPESFCSSSHGAGRAYSRTGAKEAFSVEEVMVDLKNQNVVLGKKKKLDIAEECRFAYKDIDMVMRNQTENVEIVKRLRTLGVVKG